MNTLAQIIVLLALNAPLVPFDVDAMAIGAVIRNCAPKVRSVRIAPVRALRNEPLSLLTPVFAPMPDFRAHEAG